MPNNALGFLLWLIVALVVIVIIFRWVLPAIFGSEADAMVMALNINSGRI